MNNHVHQKPAQAAHPLRSTSGKAAEAPANTLELPFSTPETVLVLQHVIGNQAVLRLMQRSTAGMHSGQIQRVLTADSTRAFKFAIAQNGAYSAAKYLTDKHVTAKEQDTLGTVRGRVKRFKSSPVAEKRLKDFLRSFLLREYSSRVSDPDRAKNRKKYFDKALETRDKYKPLIEKGVNAPETRAFLEAEGFAGGIPATPGELAQEPKIEVRSTFIGGTVLKMKVRAHLFIVFTAANGKQMYFRGGPGPTNLTQADWGDYTPGTVDWDPSAPTQLVMNGPEVLDKLDPLIEASRAINTMGVPYEVSTTGGPNENCNATAWTILDRAGIPKNKPSGVHPGWGHILGTASGKGTALPAAEDNSAPGVPYEVFDDNAPVFRDREFRSQMTSLKQGSKVELLSDPKLSIAKVRVGGKIGFMRVDSLQLAVEKGAAFTINTDVDVYTESRGVTGVTLRSGAAVEVLDASFASAPTTDGDFVKIKYTDSMGKTAIGYVPDWNLTKG